MTPEIEGAIRALADANGGQITPAMVVSAARHPESPLHSCFTWDVQQAAQERWIDQARKLIRSVRVEVTSTEYNLRAPAFVRDPSLPGGTPGYATLARVRTDEDWARDVVVTEFARASAALARAHAVSKALGLEDGIEDVQRRVAYLAERAVQATA